eukprot:CAMPEP_0204358756 /NCGR_PEP_ID=MMETSP0469-20131031/36763_1 /ASSEMBLY_ACC=CAM_ASM_000384 /TAXON_ID=2969 /ORGANISM="Oxyrrhis marina" /LENGTH=164 /DNA_ID=CAMNT_0051346681 /DNA_START=23 /DNA_END=514 /DNA_ORIENTATION=-
MLVVVDEFKPPFGADGPMEVSRADGVGLLTADAPSETKSVVVFEKPVDAVCLGDLGWTMCLTGGVQAELEKDQDELRVKRQSERARHKTHSMLDPVGRQLSRSATPSQGSQQSLGSRGSRGSRPSKQSRQSSFSERPMSATAAAAAARRKQREAEEAASREESE